MAVRSGLLDRAGIRPMGVFVVNFAPAGDALQGDGRAPLDEALIRNWDMVIASRPGLAADGGGARFHLPGAAA